MADRSNLSLVSANVPWNFWRLLDAGFSEEEWEMAARDAMDTLAGLPVHSIAGDLRTTLDAILAEGQFGPDHWSLSATRRFYYHAVRPMLPASVRPLLRRLFLAPQQNDFPLRFPIEDRYVRFQFETLRNLMTSSGRSSLPFINFWPSNHRYAFVLTHDIESARGQGFVREVAALEERYGFRSSFNVVPEDYRVDMNLLGELQERGFEVGMHGMKHNGTLFSSKKEFLRQAARINNSLKQWGSVGFRTPFTHRHPEWMQALEVEYDSSFFDTDPFETIPGGTMSIWPFMMGRFVELPFTLSQDHTLISTLGETTPRLWLEKVDFIEEHRGLAMAITHPDYLIDPKFFSLYEDFLRKMSERDGYWHALPRVVARWWRQRSEATIVVDEGSMRLENLPEGTIGTLGSSESAGLRHVASLPYALSPRAIFNAR